MDAEDDCVVFMRSQACRIAADGLCEIVLSRARPNRVKGRATEFDGNLVDRFFQSALSLQQAIEPLVGGFAFGFGEVVRGVGRGELQPIFGLEPRVDFLGLRECLFA